MTEVPDWAVGLKTWGPLEMPVDDRTREMWCEISHENLANVLSEILRKSLSDTCAESKEDKHSAE